MIPRPGLSTGLYMNTRRLGAIVSGPLIALGSLTALGNRGIFLACAVLTAAALAIISSPAGHHDEHHTQQTQPSKSAEPGVGGDALRKPTS